MKKLFNDSGLDKIIIKELKLNEFNEAYFFVPEYQKLKSFLEKDFEEYIMDILSQKDKEIFDKKKIIEHLNKKVKLESENNKLKKEIFNIRNSTSFRIGRIVTYLPRKIRGGIRCYKEHGIIYTVNRIKEKV